MPHVLLRALRHRSTPTLLPSSHRQHVPAPLARPQSFIPSIFVTVPLEEGGAHYCALVGSPYSPTHPDVMVATNAAVESITSSRNYVSGTSQSNADDTPLSPGNDSSSGFDAPLPDFEALEETISKLRDAEHAPVFRRPSSRHEEDGIIMPRRKSAHVDADVSQYAQQEAGAGRGFMPSGAKKTSRPRPPRKTNSSPVAPTNVEQFADAEKDVHFFPPESVARERVSSPPPKPNLFRRLSRKPRPAPLTSISYESVVASRHVVSPPLTSPTDPFAFEQASPTSPTQEASNSDGDPKRKKRNSLKRLFLLEKRERASVVYDTMQPIQEVVISAAAAAAAEPRDNGYTMPNCFNETETEEQETRDSNRDKPLPPLPRSQSAISQDQYVEVQICNSPVLFDVVTAARDIHPEPASEEAQEPVVSPTSRAKEAPLKSIKRKLSLKRLKERFSSTTTPAPPLPPMPAQFQPVIRPPIPSVVITAPCEWPMSPVEPYMEESTVSPRVTAESVVSAPIPDEDSNLSNGSEDSSGSSAVESSGLSSPDSTPPATPDHIVSAGGVFEAQQEFIKGGSAKAGNVDVQIVVPLSHIEMDGGISRSPGRINLGSLDARVEIFAA